MSMLDKAKELYGKAKEKVVAAKEWVKDKAVQLGVAVTSGYVAADTLVGDAAQALSCPTPASGTADPTSVCALASSIDITDLRYGIFIIAGLLVGVAVLVFGAYKIYGMWQRR